MKKKVFTSMGSIAYTDWLDVDSDGFYCSECSDWIDLPHKKCQNCGSTYKYEYGHLELIRPIIIKRKSFPKFEVAPDLVGKSGYVRFSEPPGMTGKFFKALIGRK